MKASYRIIALFFLFLSLNLTGVTQTSAQVQPTSSKGADQIVLLATVTNKKGELATGLRRDDFKISIDKKPANIIDFREEDVPASIGIIFDASGSVGDPKSMRRVTKSLRKALKGFLEISNQSNEYFLLAFNTKPQLLLDWTSDSQAIIDTLGLLQANGNTAFYDACYLGINKVGHGRYSKHVLILISDGEDNVSTYSFNQVREELRTSGVLIYSLNVASEEMAGSGLGMEGQGTLKELSLLSGGRYFYQRYGRLIESDAVSAFEIIAKELRHQYTIGFTPNVSSDNNKWHKITVKVQAAAGAPGEMKHLSARTREGFYLNHR